MTANRKAALAGVVGPAVAGLIAVLNVIENDIAQAIIVGVALLCAAAVIWKFLDGSQKWDSLVMSDGEPSVGPDREEVQVNVGEAAAVDPSPDELALMDAKEGQDVLSRVDASDASDDAGELMEIEPEGEPLLPGEEVEVFADEVADDPGYDPASNVPVQPSEAGDLPEHQT